MNWAVFYMALVVAVGLIDPAFGQTGGDGGAVTGANGAGGTSNMTGAGANGGDGGTVSGPGGGGGGGGGVTGGNGGNGFGPSGLGGAGGAFAGANGTDGASAASLAGGGGGGGAHGAVIAVTAINSMTLSGGNGGAGGAGGPNGGGGAGGGGGGAGGYGVVVNAAVIYRNTGVITGGNGGAGGDGTGRIFAAGAGGDGGYGVAVAVTGATLLNTGTIKGGNGGNSGVGSFETGGFGEAGVTGTGLAIVNSGTIVGGNGGFASGVNIVQGFGGYGLTGSNLSITDSGTISGGLSGDGITRVNAITFTGGVNSLTLQAGFSIIGNVVAASSADTLALGGNTNSSFDVSQIGPSGQYQGFGHYQKTGASTWFLTGATAALTPWVISGGTLNVSSDNALGAPSGGLTLAGGTLQFGSAFNLANLRAITLNAGGGTIDTNSFTTTISQGIAGSGGLNKTGTGTLVLSGSNTYTGGTTITAGTVVVNNAQALGLGNVTVDGGVLAADPQPINVAGNYFQGLNGTLQLVVAGANPRQYDYLNVTGNASLGGTLKLINQNFTPQAGETLSLVKAGGAIANKFANFIDPFTTRPGLNTIDLVYSLHTVDLEFLNIVPPTPPPPARITTVNFASFALTPNELAAAELLDAVELNPRFGNVLNFFLARPFGNISGELAQIGPQSFTSFYEISYSDANIQRLTLENRLDDIRASLGSLNEASTEGGTVGLQKSSADGKSTKNPVEPVLQPAHHPIFDLWASGFGDFVHVDSDFNARGYRFTTSGFDLGFDYRFLDHFAVGVLGNYTYAGTDLRPGTITVNSGRGGLYASYFNGNYYLNAGVYGGYNTYDTNRHALFGNAIGNTDGAEWSGFISTGYDFHTRKNLTIGPVASLQYTSVNISGFAEQGSLLPMSIHSASEESLRTDLGFRASYQWQVGRAVIEPYVKAEWEHEFKYSALPVTASLAQFPGPDETFYGPAEGQDSAVVSAGVSVQWTPSVLTFVGYDGQLGRGRYSSNAVNGGVRISW
jgi:outer membrane autotransporter protein